MTPTLTLIAVGVPGIVGLSGLAALLIGRAIPPSQDDALHQRGEGERGNFDQLHFGSFTHNPEQDHG